MYFFYLLITVLDGRDAITYILIHIPYQLQSLCPGFMDMDTAEIFPAGRGQQRFQQPLIGASRGYFKTSPDRF